MTATRGVFGTVRYTSTCLRPTTRWIDGLHYSVVLYCQNIGSPPELSRSGTFFLSPRTKAAALPTSTASAASYSFLFIFYLQSVVSHMLVVTRGYRYDLGADFPRSRSPPLTSLPRGSRL